MIKKMKKEKQEYYISIEAYCRNWIEKIKPNNPQTLFCKRRNIYITPNICASCIEGDEASLVIKKCNIREKI